MGSGSKNRLKIRTSNEVLWYGLRDLKGLGFYLKNILNLNLKPLKSLLKLLTIACVITIKQLMYLVVSTPVNNDTQTCYWLKLYKYN